MKKLTEGNYIDQFLIEKVLRPLKNGNALFKVRYQGSYVRGYLCVVDARHYGGGNDTNEKVLHECRELCKIFTAMGRGTTSSKGESAVILPDRVFSCLSADGFLFILGYFSHNNWFDQSTLEITDFEDLVGIAKVLDVWHKIGVGHGTIHPQGIWKTETGSSLLFSCPIFPVVLSDEESEWGYDFGNKSIEKDRKAFCQMVSDVLNHEQNDKAFVSRLKSFEANVGTIPVNSSFLCNPNITCEQLVYNVDAYKQTTDHVKKIHELKGRRNKSIIWSVIIMLICLVVFSAAAYFKEQWSEEKRRIAVNSNIAGAHHAKENSEWQVCKEMSQAVLVLQPNHAVAHSLKKEAEKYILVNKTLEEARAATKNRDWQICKKKADLILDIEPQEKEALELKRVAESKMQLVSDMVELARQARSEMDWKMCIEKAQEALMVQSGCAEATALKVHAESMIRLGALLAEGREAQENKNWVLCAQKANDALIIDNSNSTALELKNIARIKLNKLSELLVQAHEATRSKEWQVCIAQANEALSLSPNDDEMKGLKAYAEKEQELKMLFAATLEAKEKRDWQTCIVKADAVLLIEPKHLEATKVKRDAEHTKELFAALASAREAKNGSQWTRCAEMATIAMGIEDEPERSEALVLKSDAERKLNLIKFLVAAREAKVGEDWLQCKTQADEILIIEPDNTEALELKSYAERMLISALVASAHEAKAKKEWKVCILKANELLLIEPENAEAKALKEEANQNLVPHVVFKVFYNDTGVVAKFWDGVAVRTSSEKVSLEKNRDYSFMFWCKSSPDSSRRASFWAGSIKVQADWEGLKARHVVLAEKNKLEEGQLNVILKDLGVPSDQW